MSVFLANRTRALRDKAAWARYFAALRYALHVIVHPFDGFWDLTHEKRGSLAAANTIMALVLLTRVLSLEFTSFVFIDVHWEYVSIPMECGAILLPVLIWCAGNWGLTTLFDGKGKLLDVYIGTAYAFTPYILLNIPLIFISNMITWDELTFYTVISMIALIWCALLLVFGMMMIHDYTFGKTLIFTIMSLFAMAVIIFLIALFFSLLSDFVGYFVSLYREIVFRLY